MKLKQNSYLFLWKTFLFICIFHSVTAHAQYAVTYGLPREGNYQLGDIATTSDKFYIVSNYMGWWGRDLPNGCLDNPPPARWDQCKNMVYKNVLDLYTEIFEYRQSDDTLLRAIRMPTVGQKVFGIEPTPDGKKLIIIEALPNPTDINGGGEFSSTTTRRISEFNLETNEFEVIMMPKEVLPDAYEYIVTLKVDIFGNIYYLTTTGSDANKKTILVKYNRSTASATTFDVPVLSRSLWSNPGLWINADGSEIWVASNPSEVLKFQTDGTFKSFVLPQISPPTTCGSTGFTAGIDNDLYISAGCWNDPYTVRVLRDTGVASIAMRNVNGSLTTSKDGQVWGVTPNVSISSFSAASIKETQTPVFDIGSVSKLVSGINQPGNGKVWFRFGLYGFGVVTYSPLGTTPVIPAHVPVQWPLIVNGDFNRDGQTDNATFGSGPGVTINIKGKANPNAISSHQFGFQGTPLPSKVEVNDYNNDGVLDMHLIFNPKISTKLFGFGDGNFTPFQPTSNVHN